MRRIVATATGGIAIQIDRPDSAGPHHPALLIHGGGFVFGSLASHTSIARRFALASGMAVITLEYRLAPEHPAPAALDDCLAVLLVVAEERSVLGLTDAPITIMGDSAGGYLAIASALRLIKHGEPIRALGLFYPMLDPTLANPSIASMGKGYMLTREFLAWAWKSVAPEGMAELAFTDSDLAALPPTVVALAECDPLHDEGLTFVERLRQLGVPVKQRTERGMIHGFVSYPQLTPVADLCLAWFAQQIAEAARF